MSNIDYDPRDGCLTVYGYTLKCEEELQVIYAIHELGEQQGATAELIAFAVEQYVNERRGRLDDTRIVRRIVIELGDGDPGACVTISEAVT